MTKAQEDARRRIAWLGQEVRQMPSEVRASYMAQLTSFVLAYDTMEAGQFLQRYSELNKDGSFAGQSLASFDAEGRDR
jgi:hypothetical protein